MTVRHNTYVCLDGCAPMGYDVSDAHCGGARVIYYYWDECEPLYALLVYPKTAKEDLSQGDRRAVAALVGALKTALKEKK